MAQIYKPKLLSGSQKKEPPKFFEAVKKKPEKLIKKPFILEVTKDYISQLYFENGMLMNDMNYPADWDLVGSYTDQKTKDFIQMAIKNPLLIELRKQFDLS